MLNTWQTINVKVNATSANPLSEPWETERLPAPEGFLDTGNKLP